MQSHPARRLWPATVVMAMAMAMAMTVAATTAAAQTAPNPLQPKRAGDPLDAGAAVPPLVYRSALAGYRALTVVEPMPWREANDQVGRIGGWRMYLREAHAPEPAADAAPPASAAPATRPGPKPGPMPGAASPGSGHHKH